MSRTQAFRPREVGLKPPWNQPQVTPLLLSRLPTFLPLKETVGKYFPVLEEHPSYFGSRSPIFRKGPISACNPTRADLHPPPTNRARRVGARFGAGGIASEWL